AAGTVAGGNRAQSVPDAAAAEGRDAQRAGGLDPGQWGDAADRSEAAEGRAISVDRRRAALASLEASREDAYSGAGAASERPAGAGDDHHREHPARRLGAAGAGAGV